LCLEAGPNKSAARAISYRCRLARDGCRAMERVSGRSRYWPGAREMRTSKLFLAVVSLTFLWDGAAVGQGTKEPSNPVPSMVYPIRPRDEPPTSQIIRLNKVTPTQPPIRLKRIHPAR
jgi:hypothetical protein